MTAMNKSNQQMITECWGIKLMNRKMLTTPLKSGLILKKNISTLLGGILRMRQIVK
jgi:hypothetical protein